MVKKKRPFIILATIFGAVSLLTLFFTWGYSSNTTSASSMMGQSMGTMMSSMHSSNITVRDLIIQQEQLEESSVANSQASHHSSQRGFLQTAHIYTTGTIVILLPFILAGTIFLAIIWFNKPSEVKR